MRRNETLKTQQIFASLAPPTRPRPPDPAPLASSSLEKKPLSSKTLAPKHQTAFTTLGLNIVKMRQIAINHVFNSCFLTSTPQQRPTKGPFSPPKRNRQAIKVSSELIRTRQRLKKWQKVWSKMRFNIAKKKKTQRATHTNENTHLHTTVTTTLASDAVMRFLFFLLPNTKKCFSYLFFQFHQKL